MAAIVNCLLFNWVPFNRSFVTNDILNKKNSPNLGKKFKVVRFD